MGGKVVEGNEMSEDVVETKNISNDSGSSGLQTDASFPVATPEPKSSRKKPPIVDTPQIEAYAAQCRNCLKWRLIPSKERYEDIRQSIADDPFHCEKAAVWSPGMSCDLPTDISQEDDTFLWAIDKPSIPLPPQGWDRLLAIRNAGTCKFADVYYMSPSGRKLRSWPEIERFLAENPEYAKAGVNKNQFSFICPRPLDKDYCRKRGTEPSPDVKRTSNDSKSGVKKFKASKGSASKKLNDGLQQTKTPVKSAHD